MTAITKLINGHLSSTIRTILLIITIVASMYAFHKKVLIADIHSSVMTKAGAVELKRSLFPRERGERLEDDVRELQKQVREDFKEIRQDIKKILWYSKRNHNDRTP